MSTLAEAIAFFDAADQKLVSLYKLPDGFINATQLAKSKGWSHGKAQSKLIAMERNGLAEVRDFRARNQLTKIYRIFPPKEVASTQVVNEGSRL